MKIKSTPHLKYIMLACIFVISCIAGTVMLEYKGSLRNHTGNTTDAYTTTENENIINASIKGEVKVPGTYTVTKYSRISDIINLAGGLTGNADISAIDLPDVLYDGQTVEIPAKGKATLKPIIKNKININTASAAELISLPGIGYTYSAAIVSHRNKYGDFEVIEDIMNVEGIGEKRFNEIKDYICVNPTERME